MTTLSPIVEGHGEVGAVPILIRRIGAELNPPVVPNISRPVRAPRGTLLRPGELERFVMLASATVTDSGGVLVMLDADDDCPAELGPKVLQRARGATSLPVGVVLPMREFEGWFLGSASSLAGLSGLPEDLAEPHDPEGVRDAKGWLSDRIEGSTRYSPTVDQPALTAQFDLRTARDNCASFDKLWREVERLLRGEEQPAS